VDFQTKDKMKRERDEEPQRGARVPDRPEITMTCGKRGERNGGGPRKRGKVW